LICLSLLPSSLATLGPAPKAARRLTTPAFAAALAPTFQKPGGILSRLFGRHPPLRAAAAAAPIRAMASYSQSSYVPTMSPSAITFEDIATFPRPGCSAPDSINFSLDDSTVTFLSSSDGSLTRQLYAMNIASGEVKELCKPPSGTGEEDNFSLEEKLRRERARQLHTGITSYAWAEGAVGAGKILVPIGNELFVQEGLDGTLKRLFDPAVLSEGSGPNSPLLVHCEWC
jgi:hypothetical protein